MDVPDDESMALELQFQLYQAELMEQFNNRQQQGIPNDLQQHQQHELHQYREPQDHNQLFQEEGEDEEDDENDEAQDLVAPLATGKIT